jgi:FkbM family methyltransferase
MFVERRMPYRPGIALQRIARAFGRRERTVTASTGLRFRVRRLTVDELIVQNVVERREYFPPGVMLQPTDIVIDIGGNIGIFAVLASTLVPHGRVITIEPEPGNVRLLHHNIALNRSQNVEIVEAAITDRSGTTALYVADEGSYHTIRPDRLGTALARHTTQSVRSLTLPEVFDRYRIARCHLLKIDCEGAEFAFLPALPDDLWTRIDQIAMEYHTPRTTAGQRESDALLTMLAQRFDTIHHEAFSTGTGGHYFGRRRAAQ